MQSMAGESSVFPEKIRVLVVDDDPVCVKILSRMLHHCKYQVTEVAKATEAVETLANNPKGFDMVITDTRNDIEILSLLIKIMKIDSIPVILVSGLEDTSSLIKEVLEGADEVLSKPVSLAKIKNLWQHVYRRRVLAEPQPPSDPPSPDSGGDQSTGEEAEAEHKRSKRRRVKWAGALQEKFLEAVVQLGGPEKAAPKKIMELMNVPEVSRESVASHLQKYRKQKKPLFAPRNDTNSVVSLSHSCTFNRPIAAHRFGYHHHHHHNHQGFHQRRLVNGHSNFCTASVPYPSHSASLLGRLPDQQPSMLPPLPACMPPQPPQYTSAVAPPAFSVANDQINHNGMSSNSVEPWIDTSSGSSLFDDPFLMCDILDKDSIFGFQPEDVQWMLGANPISANGEAVGEQSAGDHQLQIAGDGAADSSNVNWYHGSN